MSTSYLIAAAFAVVADTAGCAGLHCDTVALFEVLVLLADCRNIGECMLNPDMDRRIPFETMPADSWPRTWMIV